MIEVVFTGKEYWGCSNHARLKAKAALVGKGDNKVIKVTKMLLIEKPYLTGFPEIGESLVFVIKDNGVKSACHGKIVSLDNDIMSAELTTDMTEDGVDKILRNINK